MKKIVIIIVLSINVQLYAQRYENLGEAFRIYNSVMGESVVRGEIGFATSKITYQPALGALINYRRYASVLALDINPSKEFHVRTQLYFDLKKEAIKPPYLSNIYYQIGWYNWRDRTVSFGYENYGANRFSKPILDFATNLKRGFMFASYNIDLLNHRSILKVDDNSQIRITPFVRYTYEYSDKYGINKGGNHKITLGSSVRWSIIDKFYIESAIYYYPKKEAKLPWDPDYTYGFGYFNWEAFKLNISYGNWIANRFSATDKEMNHSFDNGEFKIAFTWAL